MKQVLSRLVLITGIIAGVSILNIFFQIGVSGKIEAPRTVLMYGLAIGIGIGVILLLKDLSKKILERGDSQ